MSKTLCEDSFDSWNHYLFQSLFLTTSAGMKGARELINIVAYGNRKLYCHARTTYLRNLNKSDKWDKEEEEASTKKRKTNKLNTKQPLQARKKARNISSNDFQTTSQPDVAPSKQDPTYNGLVNSALRHTKKPLPEKIQSSC